MQFRTFGRFLIECNRGIGRCGKALHAGFFVVVCSLGVCILGISPTIAQDTGGGYADPAYGASASQGLTRIEQRVAQLFAIEPSLAEPNPAVPPPEGLRAVSLTQASDSVYSSLQQQNVVLAYWDASMNRARAQVEQRRAAYLENAAPAVVQTQAVVLLAQSDSEAAYIEYQTAQLVLLEQSMMSGAETLSPSPSDLPYVGDYETKLDSLRATRAVSRRAVALSRRLPLERRLIESRSQACDAAEAMRSTAYEAYTQQRIAFEVYADTVETVRDAELAFVDAVGRYNRTIVGYATETLGLELHGRLFIQMLIPLPDSEPGPFCEQASPEGTLAPQAAAGLSGDSGAGLSGGGTREPITSTQEGVATPPVTGGGFDRYRQPGSNGGGTGVPAGGGTVPPQGGGIQDPASGPRMPNDPF